MFTDKPVCSGESSTLKAIQLSEYSPEKERTKAPSSRELLCVSYDTPYFTCVESTARFVSRLLALC